MPFRKVPPARSAEPVSAASEDHRPVPSPPPRRRIVVPSPDDAPRASVADPNANLEADADADAGTYTDTGKKKATGDYEVGYCRPPVSGQIKPGEVRNPRGRGGAPNFNTIVLKAMHDKLTVRTADGEKKVKRVEAIVMKNVEKALKGDNHAIRHVIALYTEALTSVATSIRDHAADELTPSDRATLDAYIEMMGRDVASNSPVMRGDYGEDRL